MHERETTVLPAAFCWTRFGPEAGESFEEILARKNAERESCGGVFYWGIGSGVRSGLRALLAETEVPQVLFSPIRSAPRPIDVDPGHVVRWWGGTDLFGGAVTLPGAACVTSRWDPARPTTARFALVCASDEPLCLGDRGELVFAALRNICSGAQVGASQVTAVVRREVSELADGRRPYAVALRARLVWPYLVQLTEPTLHNTPRDERAPERIAFPFAA